MSAIEVLEPKRGYRTKERIGSGAWKTAYRGVAPGILLDVALLCYHRPEPKSAARDASKLLMLTEKKRFSSYVTRFHNIFPDDNGKIWIVEELLESSIEDLAPLHNSTIFCETARDLCRGLTYIHSMGLIHRDIKMDNCGIDRNGVAKIFDLGSVASDGATSWCTILTRPPEVLQALSKEPRRGKKKPSFSWRSDVWSLGATLLALRRGRYPFASEREALERVELSRKLAERAIDVATFREGKRELDERVTARAAETDAEERLLAEVAECFDFEALEIMNSMLAFNPEERPSAEALQERWTALAATFMRPVPKNGARPNTSSAILGFLRQVEAGEVFATSRQVERCIHEWERLASRRKQQDLDTEAFLQRVKEKVEMGWRQFTGPEVKLR